MIRSDLDATAVGGVAEGRTSRGRKERLVEQLEYKKGPVLDTTHAAMFQFVTH